MWWTITWDKKGKSGINYRSGRACVQSWDEDKWVYAINQGEEAVVECIYILLPPYPQANRYEGSQTESTTPLLDRKLINHLPEMHAKIMKTFHEQPCPHTWTCKTTKISTLSDKNMPRKYNYKFTLRTSVQPWNYVKGQCNWNENVELNGGYHNCSLKNIAYTSVEKKPMWKCLPPYPTASQPQPDMDADHYIDSWCFVWLGHIHIKTAKFHGQILTWARHTKWKV